MKNPLRNDNRRMIGPGLVDLQINGAFGVDFARATPGEIRRVRRRLAAKGVTAFLAGQVGYGGVRHDDQVEFVHYGRCIGEITQMTAEPNHDWKSAAGLQFLFQWSLLQAVYLNSRHVTQLQKLLNRRRAPSVALKSEAAGPDDTDLETVSCTPKDGTEAAPGFRRDLQPRGRWQVIVPNPE